MMPQMCLTDAALQFGGTLINPDGYFSAVSINSRTTELQCRIGQTHLRHHRSPPKVSPDET